MQNMNDEKQQQMQQMQQQQQQQPIPEPTVGMTSNSGASVPQQGPMQQQAQQNRLSAQAIHQQARQLFRQYSVEKEAAENAGLGTPEGDAHMAKADRIRTILVSYSKRQKLLQQQAAQQQGGQVAQNRENGPTIRQQTGQISQQQQQQQQQQLSQQIPPVQSNIAPVNSAGNPGTPGMLNVPSASPSMDNIAEARSQSLSQQISSLGNNTASATSTNSNNDSQRIDASMIQQLTPAQQLQLKKRQLLKKYQQILSMSEQFKKNLLLIEKRAAEPSIDEATRKHLREKEHEVRTRLENCTNCTQQITHQLRLAQQQAEQLTQLDRSNSTPASGTATPTPSTAGRAASTQGSPPVSGATAGATPQGKPPRAQKKSATRKQGKNADQGDGSTNTSKRSNPDANANEQSTKKQKNDTTVGGGNSEKDRAKFQNLNIPDALDVKSSNPAAVKMNNRPTILGGNALNAPALANPAMVKPRPFEIEGERVLNKRKLKELVNSVASEEGETEINIDGDVEELLLDLADEFVSSVTSFASRLARHRNADNLDVRDVQLHLEKNWNIRIPGYAADEIRMLRKFVPSTVHNSKLDGVAINKSVNKES